MTKFTFFSVKKFAFALLMALAFVTLMPATEVSAKTKKAKHGTIKILTNPGGLLLVIDGKPLGETTTEYQAFDLQPGVHNVSVTLPNGKLWVREIEIPAGRVKCVVVNYKPLPPMPKSPCPYPVSVSAPSTVNEGEIVTFAADVEYGGTAGLRYTWTVNPSKARVISGAGTPTITVDSTGIGGQRIIATLTVDDGSADPTCRQTAQSVAVVTAPERKVIVAREFDECNNCTFDDQKARLDNLAVELQNDPSTTAYIIAYGGRYSPLSQVEVLMKRARNYMVDQRGIDASRLVIVNGGFREGDSVELWIVPSGAAAPRATPTVQAGDVKGRKK
jgi:PEGA domain